MNGKNGQKGFFRSRFSILGQAPSGLAILICWVGRVRFFSVAKNVSRHYSQIVGLAYRALLDKLSQTTLFYLSAQR